MIQPPAFLPPSATPGETSLATSNPLQNFTMPPTAFQKPPEGHSQPPLLQAAVLPPQTTLPPPLSMPPMQATIPPPPINMSSGANSTAGASNPYAAKGLFRKFTYLKTVLLILNLEKKRFFLSNKPE